MTRYYSEPQLELLKVVRILGCMEKRQARALLRLRYGLTLDAVDSIIRQLRCDGKIKFAVKTGLLLSPDGRENPYILPWILPCLLLNRGMNRRFCPANRIVCCMPIIPNTARTFGSCMYRRGQSREKACWLTTLGMRRRKVPM